MFRNKKFIKFIQKSKEQKEDILCINVFDIRKTKSSKSEMTLFINSAQESIGFGKDKKFEKYMLSYLKEVMNQRKGRYVVYNTKQSGMNSIFTKELFQSGLLRCWVEPFYFENNYGSIGKALENINSGVSSTLVRSTKNPGAHSFTPDFDESNNYFNSSNNLFYQKIESPLKLLLLGNSEVTKHFVKVTDSLGWQVTICDTKGSSFKDLKLADDIILLDNYKSANKVVQRHFDAAVVVSNNLDSHSEYLMSLLKSNIPYIGVIDSCSKSKYIIDSFHMKNSIVTDDRLHLLSKVENLSIESKVFKICAEIDLRREIMKEKSYELL